MRFAAIAIAALVAAGCGDETLLRITVHPGVTPVPAALRLTLAGAGFATATRTFAAPFSSALADATLVVRGLPADADVCVQAEGLDGAGAFLVGGSTTVHLLAGRTTLADVQMSNAFVRCPAAAGDMGGDDLAVAPDLGDLPDAAVAPCPAGALFCDDFESGTFASWSQYGVKYGDMGSLAPSMTHPAHGQWSAAAHASGLAGIGNYAELERDFAPAVAPPVAMRANFYLGQAPTGYTILLSMYDFSGNAVSFGGDGNTTWVITEVDGSNGNVVDHHSTVATAPGAHCLEVFVDAAGMVSAYVDGAEVVAPFARTFTQPYGAFIFGIARTVQASTDVWADDVAIGTTRLYCP